MKKMSNSREAGFTFIEIVVVLVILGIIAAIAVPKFIGVTSDAKKVAAEGSYAAMKSACTMAFAKHRAAQLDKTGNNDDQYITDSTNLAYFIEGGFPKDITVNGKEIKLQDGTTVTIEVETNDTPARLTRK